MFNGIKTLINLVQLPSLCLKPSTILEVYVVKYFRQQRYIVPHIFSTSQELVQRIISVAVSSTYIQEVTFHYLGCEPDVLTNFSPCFPGM